MPQKVKVPDTPFSGSSYGYDHIKKYLEADSIRIVYNPRPDNYLVIAKRGSHVVRGIVTKKALLNKGPFEAMAAIKSRLDEK